MGLISGFRTALAVALRPAKPPTFDILPADIDPALFGLPSWSTVLQVEPRISRREAIQVGAVKRSRDLIAGTIGALPLCLYDGEQNRITGSVTSKLLEQPELDRPRSVTVTDTIEDMLFEKFAWWRIIARGATGYPTRVRKLDARSVDIRGENRAFVRPDGAPQGAAWEWVPDSDLIRFESPNDALLIAGARAIRTLLRLDAAAGRYAEEPMPSGYFTPAEGADPADDDDVTALLDAWKLARQARTTGYVPAAAVYNVVQWSPADMQLTEARDHGVKEVARIVGVDPEDLGVSTTSRTYLNGEQRPRDFINFTLGAYLAAFEGRLSMGDITPRGYYAKVDLDQFLQADSETRWKVYAIAKGLDAITSDEIRYKENEPALPEQPAEPTVPAPVQPPGQLPVQQGPAAVDQLRQHALAAAADLPTAVAFDLPDAGESFAVDMEARTIYGLAVPYGVASKRKNGRVFTFDGHSLQLREPIGRTKLLVQHNQSEAVGKAIEFTNAPDGLWVLFKVDRSPEGDRALEKAAAGTWDGLSVGLGQGGQYYELPDGTTAPRGVPLAEVSLTPDPAFDDARVSAVAGALT